MSKTTSETSDLTRPLGAAESPKASPAKPAPAAAETPEQELGRLKRAYSAAVLDGKTTRAELESMRRRMQELQS